MQNVLHYPTSEGVNYEKRENKYQLGGWYKLGLNHDQNNKEIMIIRDTHNTIHENMKTSNNYYNQ